MDRASICMRFSAVSPTKHKVFNDHFAFLSRFENFLNTFYNHFVFVRKTIVQGSTITPSNNNSSIQDYIFELRRRIWRHDTSSQLWTQFKSDFLRSGMSRIGRNSRKINFSFISPKHTFGWNYSRKNSLKFQRFILRPKFKVQKFVYNGGFRGLKSSKFHASLRKQQGRKNNPMKTKRDANTISFLYFKFV